MIIKPMKKNVLIAENKVESKTVSGIILDGVNSVRDSRTGTVLAVGPEVQEVVVGDVVLLDWSKGSVVKVDDAQRVMINVEHIVAVVDK
jgi:co-chaperonin GroES (HSP10)